MAEANEVGTQTAPREEESESAIEGAIDACLASLNVPLDDDDPRTLLRFLLRMARYELEERAPAFKHDPILLQRFEALIAARPPVSLEHAQLFIDAESAFHRAEILRRASSGGPILALGDDDAVSIALLILGVDRVEVADIDEPLLEFLERSAEALGSRLRTHRVDVFEEAPSDQLLERFELVFTDPPRSYEDGLAFIAYGARCLSVEPTSRLYYADHEDWNEEHASLSRALRGLGLEQRSKFDNIARYALVESWIPALDVRASALGMEASLLRELIALIPARSHLYELAFTLP